MSYSKMCSIFKIILFTIIVYTCSVKAYFAPHTECGPYGFVCERNNKVRLCDDTKPLGPSFRCPADTFCNEESTDVCENAINYIDPTIMRSLGCRRHERIADPTIPGCKGYILCVPNGSRFQGIKFKCSGNTIFNGLSRTCSSPLKYKCLVENVTKSNHELFPMIKKDINRADFRTDVSNSLGGRPSVIECKNYNLRVTQDISPARVTYFCPSRPISGEYAVRCTIFSNQFCITLERDDEDQFFLDRNVAYRRPRM